MACRYRLVQDGVPAILPYITRQLLQPTVDEFLALVQERYMVLPWEVRERAHQVRGRVEPARCCCRWTAGSVCCPGRFGRLQHAGAVAIQPLGAALAGAAACSPGGMVRLQDAAVAELWRSWRPARLARPPGEALGVGWCHILVSCGPGQQMRRGYCPPAMARQEESSSSGAAAMRPALNVDAGVQLHGVMVQEPDQHVGCRSAKSSRQQTRALQQVLQQAVKMIWSPQGRLQVGPGHGTSNQQ